MKRVRGFTLIEALVSVLILTVVMIVALTLLVSMRSFAAKQQSFTAPRQSARAAVDYLSFFLAGATDLNVESGNPNALLMWLTFGDNKGFVSRQCSFNNLTEAQGMGTGKLGLGDEGTDIITLAVPTTPIRMLVARWPSAPGNTDNTGGQSAAAKTMEINFTAGCPDDAENLKLFKQATAATVVGPKELSGLLTIQDAAGRWRYMQITNYNWSHCSEAAGTDPSGEVIHIEITPGNSDQLNPPGGWREDLIGPFTINAGVDYTSFRVRNRTLEQKTSGFDSTGVFSPGIFDPDCDKRAPGAGCPDMGFTPVVENVEDLQIAYIFQDGTVWNTGAQVLGTPGQVPLQAANDPLGPLPDVRDVVNVRALRVSVISRSNPLDIGARGFSAALDSGLMRRRALEDHLQGPPDTVATGVFDRFRLTTTMVLRNRMLGF